MALIQCLECNHQVSSDAKYCIHCGYPISEKSKKRFTVCITSVDPDPNSTVDVLTKEFHFTAEKAQDAVKNLPIILSTDYSYTQVNDVKQIFSSRSEELRITEKSLTGQETKSTDFASESLKNYSIFMLVLGGFSLLVGLGGAIYAHEHNDPVMWWIIAGGGASLTCFTLYNLFNGLSVITSLLRNIADNINPQK